MRETVLISSWPNGIVYFWLSGQLLCKAQRREHSRSYVTVVVTQQSNCSLSQKIRFHLVNYLPFSTSKSSGKNLFLCDSVSPWQKEEVIQGQFLKGIGPCLNSGLHAIVKKKSGLEGPIHGGKVTLWETEYPYFPDEQGQRSLWWQPLFPEKHFFGTSWFRT